MNKYLIPRNYWRYVRDNYLPRAKKSYSERGEDLIVAAFFKKLGITDPTYLDVGTHHPIYSNNTYLFYTRGCHGVCIEPNPDLFTKIKKWRPRDICLNVGMGEQVNSALDYYVLSATTRSTFNKIEADRLIQSGFCKLEERISVPVTTLDIIIEQYFSAKSPDFISIDTEGYDEQILRSIDLNKHRPAIFCVETLAYKPDGKEQKIDKVRQYLENYDYQAYADTHVNTIFTDNSLLKL